MKNLFAFFLMAAAAALPGRALAEGPLRIGILPIVDALPFILMEEEKRPDDIRIVSFNSALERDAALEIPREHILSMLSLNANRRQVAVHLVLPAVLPKVLTSLRIGIGTAIAVLFFVESFATSSGLGYFILDAWSRFSYRDMYAGIVGMGLLGVILYEAVEQLDRRLCRWTRL